MSAACLEVELSHCGGHTARVRAKRKLLAALAMRPCTIVIALLAIALHLVGSLSPLRASNEWIAALQLTRAAIWEWRLWTIVTGPLLHVSAHHLLFDVLGLLIVGWIFEPMFKRGTIVIVLAINIAVAIAAFAMYPDLEAYCGLSALDQGLLAAGTVALSLNRNARPTLIIAGVLVLKWTGELAFAQSSLGMISADPARYGTPVPWCHVIGGITGGLSAWAWLKFSKSPITPAAIPDPRASIRESGCCRR